MTLFCFLPGLDCSAAKIFLRLSPPIAPSASEPMRRKPRRGIPSQNRDSFALGIVSIAGRLALPIPTITHGQQSAVFFVTCAADYFRKYPKDIRKFVEKSGLGFSYFFSAAVPFLFTTA